MAPVVDANVFIRGRRRPFESAYTTPGVMDELKSDSAKLNFEVEEITVIKPKEEYLGTVKKKADEINSPTSEQDEELLALTLQKEEVIITDDKALQNLALHLDVEFKPFLQDEIEGKREWKMVCGNCGSEVSGETCSVCGSSQMDRKPV